MGKQFVPPSMTEEEWLSGQPYETMINFAIGLGRRASSLWRRLPNSALCGTDWMRNANWLS